MIEEALAKQKREMECLSEAFTMILRKNQSKNWPAKDTKVSPLIGSKHNMLTVGKKKSH